MRRELIRADTAGELSIARTGKIASQLAKNAEGFGKLTAESNEMVFPSESVVDSYAQEVCIIHLTEQGPINVDAVDR
jgi:hypothetical protein